MRASRIRIAKISSLVGLRSMSSGTVALRGPDQAHLAQMERKAHPHRGPVEELPLLDDVGARGRLRDRGGVLPVGLRVAEAHSIECEIVLVQRDPGHLERVSRRDHVVRELRGGRHLDVDLDQQIELLHRGDRLELVGPRGHGIAAQIDQRAHAPVALEQDLVRERRGGQPAAALVNPRTRSFSPKPQAFQGGIACATAGNCGTTAPGFATRSPARSQRPHTRVEA